MTAKDPRWLPENTLLHWYRIRAILGQGGFGVTYLAYDENLQQEVAIKEYFPLGIAARDDTGNLRPTDAHNEDYKYGLQRFLDEGRTLVKFDHPAIVRVTSVFEANDTAYMVMRYEQGEALSAILKQRGTLPENELLTMALALIEGLRGVHENGFIHRDIKPANIYIRADGSPVLLDFGAARQALTHHTQTLTTMVSPGYAPYEQYMSGAEHQGPWTDIYALAATLYCAASGTPPTPALDRGKAIMNDLGDYLVPLEELVGDKYSPQFVAAIGNALAFKETDRTRSLDEFRAELSGESIVDLTASPTCAGQEKQQTINIDSTNEAPTEVWQPLNENIQMTVIACRKRDTSGFKQIVAVSTIGLTLAVIGGFLLAKAPKLLSNPKSAPTLQIAAQQPRTIESSSIEATQPVRSNAKELSALLHAAKEDFSALRLTTPENNNAFEKLQRVLAIDPDNEAAKIGIQKIVVRYLELAREAGKQQQWDKVFDYFAKARTVAPNNKKIEAAEKRLRAVVDRG